jgi:hypothetical protein
VQLIASPTLIGLPADRGERGRSCAALTLGLVTCAIGLTRSDGFRGGDRLSGLTSSVRVEAADTVRGRQGTHTAACGEPFRRWA